MERPRRIRGLACGVLLAGCGEFTLPDADIVWEGELVDIAVEEGRIACAGDLALLDEHAMFVADQIGASTDERVLYVFATSESIARACPKGSGGCAFPEGALGFTLDAGFHEVAHVLAMRSFGRTVPLWEEGLASGLAPLPLDKGEHHPFAMLGQDVPSELSYPQAAHFFRWMWQADPDAMLTIYDDSPWKADRDELLATFERVVGESLERVGDRYVREAPDTLPPLQAIEESPLLEWTGDALDVGLPLACDEPQTRAYGERLARRVYFDVADARDYEIAIEPGFGSIDRVAPAHDESIDDDESLAFGLRGAAQRGLVPGRYRLDLASDTPSAVEIRVRIRPVVGVQPTLPD